MSNIFDRTVNEFFILIHVIISLIRFKKIFKFKSIGKSLGWALHGYSDGKHHGSIHFSIRIPITDINGVPHGFSQTQT